MLSLILHSWWMWLLIIGGVLYFGTLEATFECLLTKRWNSRRFIILLSLTGFGLLAILGGMTYTYLYPDALVVEFPDSSSQSITFSSVYVGLIYVAALLTRFNVLWFFVLVVWSVRILKDEIEAATKKNDQEKALKEKAQKEKQNLARTRTLEQLLNLSPIEFEKFVKLYFEQQGFTVRLTQASNDGGIDLWLNRGDYKAIGRCEGIEQCKRHRDNNIGIKPIRELYGVLAAEGVDHAYFVTTSYYTSAAKKFAETKTSLMTLVDRGEVLGWLEAMNGQPKKEGLLEKKRQMASVPQSA